MRFSRSECFIMLFWNFFVNGFVIRAILSIMGMAMDARHIFS